MTAREMRSHFVTCPKRPGRAAINRILEHGRSAQSELNRRITETVEAAGSVDKEFDFGA